MISSEVRFTRFGEYLWTKRIASDKGKKVYKSTKLSFQMISQESGQGGEQLFLLTVVLRETRFAHPNIVSGKLTIQNRKKNKFSKKLPLHLVLVS